MEVTVKLVVFWHPEKVEYCSACPEIYCSLVMRDTIENVVSDFTDVYLKGYIAQLNINPFWKKYGWQITENSVIPPTFTDEEAVKFTEESYERSITEYQIVRINVEVPETIFIR
jgi:hypothetical protein